MRVLAAAAAFVLAAALTIGYGGWRLAEVGTAYAAKIVCSGLFVSKRDLASLREVDLAADDLSFLRHVEVRVDEQRREVSASLLGLARRQAVYREGLGCALTHGRAIGSGTGGEAVVAEELKAAEQGRFDAVLDWAFAEPVPNLQRRTRAVVVVHRDQVVAERYALGSARAAATEMADTQRGLLTSELQKFGLLPVVPMTITSCLLMVLVSLATPPPAAATLRRYGF